MRESVGITRAAGVVGGATLISRILGFVRDVVIAGFFGAGLATDAFFVAFRIPNLLRRLFAEGTLSMTLIPVLTDIGNRQGRQEMFRLAQSAMQIAAAVLTLLVMVGIWAAPALVAMLAPGLTREPQALALAVELARIMMPYILCIGLVSVAMGILNTLGHFAAPALAPVLLNIAMIGSVFLTASWLSPPVRSLAYGVMAGGLLQVGLQVPILVRYGMRFWPLSGIWHPGLVRIGRLLGPAAFGAAIYQVNLLVGTLLASLLPYGSISCLYYADRLVQFPLGVFAVTLATAVMPTLSRQAARADLPRMGETFVQSLGLVLFVSVPAMVGLMVIAKPLVGLLFQRGAFDASSTRLTASALAYYSIGLWASAAVRIVLASCYALGETRAPVRAGWVSVGSNLILGWALMGPLGIRGLALASALASMVNLLFLLVPVDRRIGGLNWTGLIRSTAKTSLCAAIMGIGVWGLMAQMDAALLQRPLLQLAVVGIGVVAGVALFALTARWLRCPELEMVLRILTGGGPKT